MTLFKEDIPHLSLDQLHEHIRLSKVRSDEYLGLVKALDDELARRDPGTDYRCRHCGHSEYRLGQIRTMGGFFSAVFSAHLSRYTTLICQRCHHVDVFKR